MTTARWKVFVYLKGHRGVSAAQIGRALGMTTPAVRHHLGVLCSDGRAEQVEARKGEGRGRPVKCFGVSGKFVDNNLALLSDLLLEQRMQGLPAPKRLAVVRSLADRLASRMEKADPQSPAAKRLAAFVAELSRMNYQARWEAGAEGPRVLLGRCPYAAIIAGHPELCQMDRELIAGGTNQPVRQDSQIGVGSSTACVFQLK